jgi:hypothetical protein
MLALRLRVEPMNPTSGVGGAGACLHYTPGKTLDIPP